MIRTLPLGFEINLLALLLSINFSLFGQKELKLNFRNGINSRTWNASIIKDLSEVLGKDKAKEHIPNILSATNEGANPFMLSFLDINKNGDYNDIGVDMVSVSKIVSDSIDTYQSASCKIFDGRIAIMVHKRIYKFNYINLNKRYVSVIECDNCNINYDSTTTIKLIDSLPRINIQLANGELLNLSSLIGHGRYIYLKIWGSWCNPCIREIPELIQLNNNFKEKIFVVGLNYKDTREEAVKSIEKYGMNWINGYSNEEINGELLATGVPWGILFDSDGKLIKTGVSVTELTKRLSQQ